MKTLAALMPLFLFSTAHADEPDLQDEPDLLDEAPNVRHDCPLGTDITEADAYHDTVLINNVTWNVRGNVNRHNFEQVLLKCGADNKVIAAFDAWRTEAAIRPIEDRWDHNKIVFYAQEKERLAQMFLGSLAWLDIRMERSRIDDPEPVQGEGLAEGKGKRRRRAL